MRATPETVEAEDIIDATGLILGRVASFAAKRLLSGRRVTVVNAERAIVSGRRASLVRAMKEFLEVGSHRKGPFHPRRPDTIVKRAIRGMLPWKKPRGKDAYSRLRVFIGAPEGVEKGETIPEADGRKLTCPYVTVGELAEEIGWKPKGRAA